MSNQEDFVIKKGVLMQYKGPGGDVVIPDNVTDIEIFVFSHCKELVSISIPEGITEIKSQAFYGCTNLTSITIPQTVTKIGTQAFDGCSSLSSITIPEGVKKIGESAFSNCHGLTHVIIPDSITKIGRCSFSNCTALTSITLPKQVTQIEPGTFFRCNRLSSINIPEGVTEIGDSAFCGCTSLTNITIPESVTYIGRKAFENCSLCTHVINDIVYIDKWVMYTSVNIKNAIIQDGTVGIADDAFSYRGNLVHITIPESVTKIGKGAFSCCRSLTQVTIPDKISEIGASAFSDCSNLINITIPESVTKIGENAFCGCTGLTSITIPGNVTEIGNETFKGCSSLTSITIPESVTKIGSEAFLRCPSLKSLCIPGGIDIPKDLFSGLPLKEVRCNLNVEKKMSIGYADCLQFIHLTPEVIAALTVYQTTVQWWPRILQAIEEQNIDRSDILNHLAKKILAGKKPSAALENRILEYLTAYRALLNKDTLQNLIHALKEKKSKLVQKLEEEFEEETPEKSAGELIGISGRVEKIVAEHFQMSGQMARLKSHISSGVSYADKNGICSIDAILLVLEECLHIPDNSRLDAMDCWHTVLDVPFSEYADQVVQGLDSEEFQKLMQQLVEDKQCVPAALAMGRYGGETQAEYLTAKMDEWKSCKSSKVCKRNQIIGRTALLESGTVSAIVYFEKKKQLELYAQHHHKDPHDLWFCQVLRLGLNGQGQKQYDLGENKKLQITVQPDLTVELYDLTAQKTVKRVPKKGADPEKYQQVTDSISVMKKELKYVVKHGRNMLLDDFLSGAELTPEQWRKRYSGYIARILAAPLVWEQKRNSFLITEDGVKDWNDAPCALKENQNIRLAHPMEMAKEDLTSWQRYFTSHSIRQPFLQIWEPVVDFSYIKEDRYKDCLIPYNTLRNHEMHGIYMELNYFEDGWYAYVHFKDCESETVSQGDNIEVIKFSPKCHTRYTNHIASYLDWLTVQSRILKDDVTIETYLPGFTLAQITDFINLATENNCPNVTALLLNYKNEHFSDFDPMEEFTLGEL